MDQIVNSQFQLQEFMEEATINQLFHVWKYELKYNMIIGQEILTDLVTESANDKKKQQQQTDFE